MTISEKVAYIQGLYDGLGLDSEKSGEARILSEMLDVLKEVGLQLDGMDAAMDQFDDELDTLGDTVAELEDAVFDDEEEDDGDFEDHDDTDEDFFEIPCPSCGEDLIVDDEALGPPAWWTAPPAAANLPCPLRTEPMPATTNKREQAPSLFAIAAAPSQTCPGVQYGLTA